MKQLSCKDLGAECDFVAQGETMEELKEKLCAHASTAHPEKAQEMKNMDEDQKKAMEEKMMRLVKDV